MLIDFMSPGIKKRIKLTAMITFYIYKLLESSSVLVVI